MTPAVMPPCFILLGQTRGSTAESLGLNIKKFESLFAAEQIDTDLKAVPSKMSLEWTDYLGLRQI